MINDNFSFGVEIDLEKSRIDENGDVIIEGLASTGDEDFQGHQIMPDGWDLGYFLRKGFLKWEHSKDPRNFIGEPIEARATKAGLHVKGRLYGGLPKTQEVVELIDGMKKSQSSRKIGMSIEGSALERDLENPNRITKAVLRNVALTANPVNDCTWVDLVKSLASEDSLKVELDETEMLLKQALSNQVEDPEQELEKALTADQRDALPESAFGVPEQRRFPMPDKKHARLALQMLGRAKNLTAEQRARIKRKAHKMLGLAEPAEDGDSLEKALGVDSPGGQVLQTQDLEQDGPVDMNKERKRRKAIIDAFRDFVQSYLQRGKKDTLKKSLNLATYEGAAGFAMAKGLDEDEVEEFASFINKNQQLLKSLAVKVLGGELKMSVIDELQKSLDSLLTLGGDANATPGGDTMTEDELFKSVGAGDEPEDGDDDLDFADEDSADADDDLGGDEDGDDDGDDEDTELVKSLMSEDPQIAEAFEVTGFLRAIANKIGRAADMSGAELRKSMATQNKFNAELTKSLGAVGKVMIDLHQRAEAAEQREQETTELVKSLSDKLDVLMAQPVGRKGVVNQRDLFPLTKGMNVGASQAGADGNGQALMQVHPDRVVDLLLKGMNSGEVDRLDVTRFETGGFRNVSQRGISYLQRNLQTQTQ